MKLGYKDIEGFLKQEPSCLGVLVYGPDVGLIRQRETILAKHIADDPNDPFACVEITSDQLKDDPALLGDELSSVGFGTTRRLVKIRDAATGISGIVKNAVTQASYDTAKNAFLLVTAGDLVPSSGLRKLFESDKQLVALPCYHDDARSLHPIVQAELTKRGFLQTNRDIISYICQACQGDRMVVLSELAKLDLYMGESRDLTLNDIIACIKSTTESSFDDICEATADGNQNALTNHLQKALHQGAMPVGILRAVQRYYTRLHQVAGMMAEGTSQDKAISSLRPPVFFKQKPAFTRHVSRFAQTKRERLWNILHLLYDAELACKRSGSNPELMCSRALMKIASMGKKA